MYSSSGLFMRYFFSSLFSTPNFDIQPCTCTSNFCIFFIVCYNNLVVCKVVMVKVSPFCCSCGHFTAQTYIYNHFESVDDMGHPWSRLLLVINGNDRVELPLFGTCCPYTLLSQLQVTCLLYLLHA